MPESRCGKIKIGRNYSFTENFSCLGLGVG